MALINVAKMLSRRLFSRGTRGVSADTGQHITDEKLRSLYVSIKQTTAEANQLRDDCHAVFAIKRAVTRDRVIWSWFIVGVGINAIQLFGEILKMRDAIKDKESQLSAPHAEKQESRLPALSA
ncbi:hypothetical protein MKW92_003420 [Papaver armeniacum]|nr:hypothetical protein MKW92_003420 [Papaver armeniacum]